MGAPYRRTHFMHCDLNALLRSKRSCFYRFTTDFVEIFSNFDDFDATTGTRVNSRTED